MSSRAAARLETLGFSQVFLYRAGKQDWFAFGLPREGQEATTTWAGDVMRKDAPTCQLEDRVEEVKARLPAGWNQCIAVSEEGVVLGLLDEKALESSPEQPLEQLMVAGPRTFRPNVSVNKIGQYLRDRAMDLALITSPDGKLMGALRLEDLIRIASGQRRAV